MNTCWLFGKYWLTELHQFLFKWQAHFIHFPRKLSAKYPILKNHNWLLSPSFKHKWGSMKTAASSGAACIPVTPMLLSRTTSAPQRASRTVSLNTGTTAIQGLWFTKLICSASPGTLLGEAVGTWRACLVVLRLCQSHHHWLCTICTSATQEEKGKSCLEIITKMMLTSQMS